MLLSYAEVAGGARDCGLVDGRSGYKPKLTIVGPDPASPSLTSPLPDIALASLPPTTVPFTAKAFSSTPTTALPVSQPPSSVPTPISLTP
ncbi:MAG: hypothetical protein WDW38_008411 [Sanguina aurantia]